MTHGEENPFAVHCTIQLKDEAPVKAAACRNSFAEEILLVRVEDT